MNNYLGSRVRGDWQNDYYSFEVSLIFYSSELNTFGLHCSVFYNTHQTSPYYKQVIFLLILHFCSLVEVPLQLEQFDGQHHYHSVTSCQNTNHKEIADNFILVKLKYLSYN